GCVIKKARQERQALYAFNFKLISRLLASVIAVTCPQYVKAAVFHAFYSDLQLSPLSVKFGIGRNVADAVLIPKLGANVVTHSGHFIKVPWKVRGSSGHCTQVIQNFHSVIIVQTDLLPDGRRSDTEYLDI